MKPIAVFTAGRSPALKFARQALQPHLTEDPAGATHLLLPVPSFDPGGAVKGGFDLESILKDLPPDVTVIGGNLAHPALDGYQIVDLLNDPFYTAENAAITAHCALGLILASLSATLPGLPILIIGAGRIGKCLALLLQGLEADVTLAARKATDRAMAQALGFQSVTTGVWDPAQYRVIVNTVPAAVLDEKACAPNALLLDLASVRGISGDRVRWARGLPGICAPETSGNLIARRVLGFITEQEGSL